MNRRAEIQRIRERARAHPAMQRARERRAKKRQRAMLVALVLVILVLLLMRCDCSDEPLVPGVPDAGNVETPTEVPEVANGKVRKRLNGKVKSTERTDIDISPPGPPPWLAQLKLQVGARSPVLAACFNGAEQPGALRWSALVEAKSGRVSEVVLEPVFAASSIDGPQETCAREVLTRPFKLVEADPQAVPRRVSLILEF